MIFNEHQELPIATVRGESYTDLPQDLYIPPDALQIFLAETFTGPLDLLLYLIRKQNLNILDIPVADITRQYMAYVEVMKDFHLELAAEYLVMAAMLAEIKSRMLLPRPVLAEEEEDDPRSELIRRLLEYERFKESAESLDQMPRMQRDIYPVAADMPQWETEQPLPDVDLKELFLALSDVLHRAELFTHHHIQKEPLSVSDRMVQILGRLKDHQYCEFVALFTLQEGRMGVVVSFLAILELRRNGLIELVQADPLGPIHIRASEV